MSKLSDKFAAGKKALQERAPTEEVARVPASSAFQRAPGPQHGSVTTMKIEVLKAELDVYKAAKPTLKLRPNEVQASAWANRHQDSFETPEFASLRAEIESAGGNIQPIKVRPLKETDLVTGAKYEIVFGHRRHRACLELGIEVNAIVDDIDEKTLFIEMDRENRERADLRPYEQGMMYLRALDSGLFTSLRALAKGIGGDSSNISKSIAVAKLPEAILDCFESRLDIKVRWGASIKEAFEKEPDLLLSRAADIKEQRLLERELTSQAAFDLLVGKAKNTIPVPRRVAIGKITLSIAERNQKVTFEFNTPSKFKLDKIESFIASILAE